MPQNRAGRLAFVLLVCCVLALIGRNLYHRWCNQALFEAVKARDLKAVRLWLDRGGDPDYQVQLDLNGRRPTAPVPTVSVHSLALEALAQDPAQDTEDIVCLLSGRPGRRASDLQSALVWACRLGRLSLVHRLLDLGASPEATSAQPRSPVAAALDYSRNRPPDLQSAEMRANSLEMVRLLQAHGARLTLRDAIRLGDVNMVRTLLNAGGDPNTPSSAFEQSPLSLAVLSGRHEMLDLLLAHGAKPDVVNLTGNTPLSDAILRGDRYAVRALLAHGADPGRATSRRLAAPHTPYSPLAETMFRHSELIPDLLAAGADINAWGGVPLRTALMAQRPDLVRELLRRGAHANIPRTEAPDNGSRQATSSLLELAIRNDPASFEPLLQAGADIIPDRPTILLTAATYGRGEMIPRLLALGADVNATAADQETVLTAAVVHTPSWIKFLLDHGARPNVITKSARTPLILAVEMGNVEAVRLLLSHGADVNVLPARGHSALYYARKHRRADLVELLQRAGATVDR